MIYELNKEITEALDKYYECFDLETGELIVSDQELESIQKQLEELQNKKDDFQDWLLKKRANTIANIVGIENEIKRLSDMKTKLDKQVKQTDNFIEYLFKDILEKGKSFVFNNFTLGYRKSSAVNVKEDFNNPEYMKEKITISVDKTKIKEDIKAGKEIEGAYIEERKTFYIK